MCNIGFSLVLFASPFALLIHRACFVNLIFTFKSRYTEEQAKLDIFLDEIVNCQAFKLQVQLQVKVKSSLELNIWIDF